MVQIVSIVGRSGSGKTTFLEKLLSALVAKGVRVGTIKHHGHKESFDPEGKDTWKHRRAGAKASCLVSGAQIAFVQDVENDPDPRELTKRFFSDFDLVLAEGYKHGDLPKVEVFRGSVHDKPVAGASGDLIAMVTDDNIKTSAKQFGLDQADALAEFLLVRLGIS